MPGEALKREGIAGVTARAEDYRGGCRQGARMVTRGGRPVGRPCDAAAGAAAGLARLARVAGTGMPWAGRVSARHRICQIAINTVVLVSIRPTARVCGAWVFRFGASKPGLGLRPGGPPQALACGAPA